MGPEPRVFLATADNSGISGMGRLNWNQNKRRRRGKRRSELIFDFSPLVSLEYFLTWSVFTLHY